MSVSISRATFEHHREAFGIGEAEPRISWRFEGDATNWEQASYELEVIRAGECSPLLYSQNTSTSVLVPWPGDPLGSAETASIRVRSHGQEGQSSTPWSDWVSVETGLLNQDDWGQAVPIVAESDQDPDKPKRPVYFRKDFSIEKQPIKSARLYITALGIFEAEVNGKLVGDHKLAPGFQAYADRHVYDTYDITELIKSGDNAIGVTVAEGWWAGRLFTSAAQERNMFGDRIGVLSLVVITLKDGSVIQVPSDETWSAGHGPIFDAQFYDGEQYDARLEKDIDGWLTSGFDDSNWFNVKETSITGALVSPDGPPVREIEQIKPKEIITSPSGKLILDFGQNFVGWLRLNELNGPEGTNITLHHAEVLDDGELAIRPLRTAKARDTLVLNGKGPRTWEPRFTFHGFRYAQIDGWPEDETPFTADSVTGIVIHSDMEQTGWFETSDPLINQLHSNVRWSMKGNFVSVPTDCPQRDERVGWTGDANAFGPTSNFLYDTAGFWRGWHRDVYHDMVRSGGVVPFWVPITPGTVPFAGNAAAVWGDVAVFGPWNLWQAFGDRGMLAEQYDQATMWLDKGIPRTEGGLWQDVPIQFGDWLDPSAPAESPQTAMTKNKLVADAYLIRSTEMVADISLVLGQCAAASRYRSEREDIRKAFLSKWTDGADTLANHTQTAYALAVEFDILNDKHRASAAEKLRSIVAENDYLIGTGFAGTQQIGFALHSAGHTHDFYEMLMQTEAPSWLYQVVMNATTTWERWDSLLPDGSVNPGEMTSFNHYAFGAVADWMHQVIGGLAPETPGWKVVKVAPVPGGGITSARTTYVSAYGEIKAAWEVDEDGFTLELQVPPNSRAVVTMPRDGEVKEVGSGKHVFRDSGYHSRE